jgi:hypothetical protein
MPDDSKDQNQNRSRGVAIDNRYISAGLAALGVLALAVSGFISFTTPGEEECREELTEVKVKAASCTTRVELLSEAKDACKDALRTLTEND